MAKGIYDHREIAKDGTEIPVFKSKKSMESRYAPIAEAKRIFSNLEKSYRAFLILGFGSGALINEILQNQDSPMIICMENSNEDLNFILNSLEAERLRKEKKVLFCTKENLYYTLTENYLPAKYGALKILENKAWNLENKTSLLEIQKKINHALNVISADYSVQCHFGKIWTQNIISNLRTLNNIKNKTVFKIDNSKIAAVIAAGPTLDESIKIIEKEREKYFIIATDTAFQSLLNRNIKCDMAVSIDAQNISSSHFFSSSKSKSTIFAFDLTASKSAVKNVEKAKGNLFFFVSAHPMSSFINEKSGRKLPYIYSGSGTVTISAVSLACNLSFSKIHIFGADFSYNHGKPYTKGTYLEFQFLKNSNKTSPQEKNFSKLMYRTEVKKLSENKITTPILMAYKSSLEDFLEREKFSFRIENDIYIIENKICNERKDERDFIFKQKDFSYSVKDFFKDFAKSEKKIQETILLPLIAALKQERKASQNLQLNFSDFIKLAQSFLLRYN